VCILAYGAMFEIGKNSVRNGDRVLPERNVKGPPAHGHNIEPIREINDLGRARPHSRGLRARNPLIHWAACTLG
jgi:hypothetical protein